MINESKVRGIRMGRIQVLGLGLVCMLLMLPNAMAQGPILSASEVDYPPFCIVDDQGRAGGFSVELMRAALKAMGHEVTFRTGPWAEVRGWLERGDVQALPLVGRNPEREFLFDFTFPYMSLHGAIVVRQDTKNIQDLNGLRGRTVAVLKGDNTDEFLRREDRGMEIHTTATFEEALQELSEGRYDAVIIQRLVALRLIQETGLTNLHVVNRPIEGFRQDFCFAVKEGDRETLALLNEGLSIVMADGTYRHLHAKWFAALELPSHRRIVIGGDHDFAPFEYLDENGRPAGYNVDLTRAIAREMGLDIEIRLGPWAEIVQDMEEGRIDLMQGMFYLPERDLKFDFTQPHTVHHYVSVVRRGEGDPPTALDDLSGKRIVVQRRDAAHDFLVGKGLGDQVSLAETQEDVLRELSEGKHDCALAVRIGSLHLIQERGWKNLVLGRQAFLPLDYCYAAPNGHKAILAQFSEGLKVLEENGEYQRIQEKWLGVYQEKPPSLLRALRYSAMVLIPLALLFLGFFLWSWSLRREVTDRTRELKESEEFQRAMIACTPVALYSIDLKGKVLAWNASAERIFGWAAEEVMGKPLPIIPEDRQNEFSDLRKRLFQTGGFSDAEVVRQRKHGTLFDASLSAAPIYDAQGGIIGIMASMEDITLRKQAEAALRQSEANYRLLVENQTDLVVKVDLEGRFLFVSPSYCRMFGKKEEELFGKKFTPLVHEEDRGPTEEAMKALYSPPHTAYIEQRAMTKEGWLWLAWVDTAVLDSSGNVKEIIGVGRDITERKRDQSRIEHLNQVLRAIRDVNQLIVRERDREKLIREGCRLLVANHGYSSALIVLTDDQDRAVSWATAGLAEASPELGAMLEQGTLPPCCEGACAEKGVLLINDRDLVCGGCPIAERCGEGQSLSAPLNHDGTRYGYLAVCAEIQLKVDDEECGLFSEMTEDFAYALNVMQIEAYRREGETALHTSEKKYRDMIQNLMEGFYSVTLDGNLLEHNREFAGILKLDPEKNHAGIEAPDFWRNPDERQSYLEALEKHGFVKGYEIKAKNAEGEKIVVLANARIVKDRHGNAVHIEGSFLDITAQKRAERARERLQAQLIQAQKMESVGRLAGGVAHDYNNMLSVIIGNAELALGRAVPGDPLHEELREILDAARRSTDITRQLLAFARKQTIRPKALDLNETVEGMLKMLRRLIGEDIDLSWRPGRGLWPVKMDPSQLDQALANLLVNARDAIGGVGKVTIETGKLVFDETYCADHAGFVPGEFVLLAVSDDGCGMDRKTLASLFEPFFTTKGVGEGSGLGLATVYGIVKQNDGFINVYSEPGEGSTFKIYLPRHAGEAENTEVEGADDIPPGRGETVLIVEDEASILRLAKRILEQLGYTVLESSTPGRAMDLAQEHAGEIHLLITDVVMPEMNGRDLAGKLQALYPGLKVLFMSGYTANIIAHRGVLDADVHFMQKPFSNRDLAVKVREALEGTG